MGCGKLKGSWYLFAVILIFIFSSCSNNQGNVDRDAFQLARLECDSRTLTHTKFLLAQAYQNYYDSVNNKLLDSFKKIKRLNDLDIRKQHLLAESQMKSDSVNALLKKLWTNYKTDADKKRLDDATADILKKTCPLSSP